MNLFQCSCMLSGRIFTSSLFLTPLPPRIIDLMATMGDNYAYIDELRAHAPGSK